MTSNLGAPQLLAAAAAGRPVEEVREQLLALARAHFRPEFLNRIDETVLFHALDRDQLRRITELMLAQTADRLPAQGITPDMPARPRWTGWPSTATSPSSGPGRCAARSPARWTASCPG